MEWPSKKGSNLAVRPGEQNEKAIKRTTFIKVMSAKKDQIRSKDDNHKSNVF